MAFLPRASQARCDDGAGFEAAPLSFRKALGTAPIRANMTVFS
jgi:hypothetical protein